MNSIADTAPNLDVLEGILSALRDQAKSDYPALVLVMIEAVKICQSRHGVHAGVNLQLQAALTSIREERPDDAMRYIQIALDIEEHWVGGVTEGFESTAEIPQLEKTVGADGWSRTPWMDALLFIAATLLCLPVGAFTLVTGALKVAARPLPYLHDRATALLGALLREMGWRL
jgi:hypothetical protein